MANLNFNTIRIYTLLPPVFYEAFYEFNKNRESPIYLLQEIWPEEHPLNSDYLAKDYNAAGLPKWQTGPCLSTCTDEAEIGYGDHYFKPKPLMIEI